MAEVFASGSLDLTDFDASRISDGFVGTWKGGPFVFEDLSYDQYAELQWIYRVEFLSSVLLGKNVDFTDNGLVGTVSAYFEAYWQDGEPSIYWGLTGISMDAARLFQVSRTDGTKDDMALLEDVLSGDDRFDLSDYRDVVNGYAGRDVIVGNGGADVLSGNAGADRLLGGVDDDALNGNGNADVLKGQRGDDVLRGGRGDDALLGGRGQDRLIGGVGEDAFLYTENDGRDVVVDFADDVDTLVFADCLWTGDLTRREVVRTFATVENGDVVFDFGDGDRLIVRDVTYRRDLFDDVRIVSDLGDAIA
ncbi:calcium-binding protein [Tropicimonas isoalkanivorans]|uniref:Hemolysin-type calcium-binding repeat-containing protein n=1 Tax=Tropicimonas isoalkanivorans TaxID=441112 RepID=A0A1I1IGA3_9RHOB|nr:calcium-binding protein [Tropicimonas isoalkanivorans]SFC35324.1 hypothetical protein SAMN04488094_10480 [Tropicimonas isoalkanivorans]